MLTKLCGSDNVNLLAPLAGVSDFPFRRVCQDLGASLTYVEMLSATALCYGSKRTFEMLARHEDEPILGVQLTGKSAEETAKAVAILEKYPFETVDINMGCPVKKVVSTGCGSAILKDPKRVYETVKMVRGETDKSLSAKIRIGWDQTTVNALEVAAAIEEAGADWITVHGRVRNATYGDPVQLDVLAEIKKLVTIPVIGNGNIFQLSDAEIMREQTKVDGVMVSRGALGNPWLFRDLKLNKTTPTTLSEWLEVVLKHLAYQKQAYGNKGQSAITMRKHLLWYAKGWPTGKRLREKLAHINDLNEAVQLFHEFYEALVSQGVQLRQEIELEQSNRFVWDPKFEMDRSHDRGVGDDQLNV